VHITQPQQQQQQQRQRAPGPAKRLTKITPAPAPTPTPPAELPTISVSVADVRSSRVPGGATAGAGAGTAAGGERKKKREVLPEVGNVVLCRVIRITPRQAVVAILVCGDSVLEAEWQGLIRVQDVRATEKDRVKIYESFRPGDVVRAEVVSSSFFFSFSFLSRLGG
jgi:exosome complex component CSL4